MRLYDNQITKVLDKQEPKTEKTQKAQKTGKPKKKAGKKNALILCHDENEFWTTQKQFWQWAGERVVVKLGDHPLTGKFTDRDEEKTIILANTILNLRRPNHIREVMNQRKLIKRPK